MVHKIKIVAEDGLTSATFVPALGGLLVSLRMPDKNSPDKARELLYMPDDFDWEKPSKISGGFPLCFPICGRLTRSGEDGVYVFDGKRYTLGIHGFAHLFPWEVLYAGKSNIGMRLSHNEETLKNYPFEFELQLHFEVRNGELSCQHRYMNVGESQVMPYYAGFHPYFLIDPSRYKKDQVFLCANVSGEFFYNKALNDVVSSNEEKMTLSAPLSSPGLNERLFYFNQEAGFELHFPDRTIIGMDIEDIEEDEASSLPFMQLYHQPEKPFFCVEPWMSHPNAMNTQFATHVLFPGEIEDASFRISMKSWE